MATWITVISKVLVSVHDKITSCVIVVPVLFADDFVKRHLVPGIAEGKQLGPDWK